MEQKNTFSTLFYLKKDRIDQNGRAPIYMRITFKGKNTSFSLHKSVDVSLWDTKMGKVLGTTKYARDINNYLQSSHAIVFEHFRTLREKNALFSIDDLKRAYLGIEEKSKEAKIIEIFEKHNEKMKPLVDIDYSPHTMMRYETALRHTQSFIKHTFGKEDLFLSELNHEFMVDFEIYLKTVRSCNNNSTMKYIKNFKKIGAT